MLIAIEGCLGAGKSTVSKGLAAFRGSQSLLEQFELNPFLASFYADPEANSIETEFAFLLLHFHQLKEHLEALRTSELIADFHLGKDSIYADLNLKDLRARELFGQLYSLCLEKTPQPDLLIFLAISPKLLIDRIRKRNRDFEAPVDSKYYLAVNEAYEGFFEHYPGQKLSISMDEWDFVQDATLYKRLSLLVDQQLNLSVK